MYVSVLFVLVGEGALLDVFDVVSDGVGHDGVEVGVASEEFGREASCHAEHVGDDEHLSVASASCSDADDGYGEFLCHACGECGWYLFEDDGEASCFFECVGIADEFLCFSFFACSDGVGAELVDGLWG